MTKLMNILYAMKFCKSALCFIPLNGFGTPTDTKVHKRKKQSVKPFAFTLLTCPCIWSENDLKARGYSLKLCSISCHWILPTTRWPHISAVRKCVTSSDKCHFTPTYVYINYDSQLFMFATQHCFTLHNLINLTLVRSCRYPHL